FFFSSRRRHTRCLSDWSSDVCSSDLDAGKTPAQKALELVNEKIIVDPIRGDFTCHVGVHNPPGALRKKALWDLFSAPERVERDRSEERRVGKECRTLWSTEK